MGPASAGDNGPEPVLFLIHDLALGGAERVFVTLVNGIDAPRPIPVLVRRRLDIADRLRSDREVHILPGAGSGTGVTRTGHGAGTAPRAPRGPRSLWIKTRGLLELAERQDAAAVSTFLHKSHVIALCAKLLRRGRLAVIVNAHEHLSQHLRTEHRGPGRLFYGAFARAFLRHADRVVVVARGVGEDLAANFGVPEARIVHVPNPVDVDGLRAAASETPGFWPRLSRETPVALAVGRLVRLKGFDLLIRAIAASEGAPIHTVLVGDGPEDAALRRLADSLGVGDRVHFAGRLENPWALMSRAGVLAVPSRTEALPSVISEAQALGLPVVAADCSPGVREAVQDGACGLLVPPDDPTALAGGIHRLIGDPALARRLAAAGRRRVAALAPTAILNRYAALLEEVLAEQSAPDARTRR